MTFIGITFQKIVFKPSEQRYWSSFKGLYNIFYILAERYGILSSAKLAI